MVEGYERHSPACTCGEHAEAIAECTHLAGPPIEYVSGAERCADCGALTKEGDLRSRRFAHEATGRMIIADGLAMFEANRDDEEVCAFVLSAAIGDMATFGATGVNLMVVRVADETPVTP